MKPKELPPVMELHRLFCYNPHTGELVRKTARTNRVKVGEPVGNLHKDGYLKTGIGSITYLVHRIVWKMFYGTEPPEQIDHRDRDRTNNKISNLRDGSGNRNSQNRFESPLGITQRPNGRWESAIKKDQRRISLGVFDCPLLAGISYQNVASTIHPLRYN